MRRDRTREQAELLSFWYKAMERLEENTPGWSKMNNEAKLNRAMLTFEKEPELHARALVSPLNGSVNVSSIYGDDLPVTRRLQDIIYKTIQQMFRVTIDFAGTWASQRKRVPSRVKWIWGTTGNNANRLNLKLEDAPSHTVLSKSSKAFWKR